MAGLTKYEPWDVLRQMRREMDNIFSNKFPDIQSDMTESTGTNWVPAVDVREEDDKFLIHADIPGVNPKDIDVSVDNGVLTIKGEKKHESSESEKSYKRVERSYGSFFRQFTLPESADFEAISAKSANGVLELIIPKSAKAAAKRQINVEG